MVPERRGKNGMELKSKLSNFWYYHKWKIIIGAFFLFVAILCITQMAGREDYDMRVLYAGPHIFTGEEVKAVEESFSQLLSKDYNGDGLKNCELRDMTIMTDAQLSAAIENAGSAASMVMYNNFSAANMESSFSQEIFAGENVICLLDPAWYAKVKESDGFVPLAEVIGKKPEKALDDCSVLLKDTDFAAFFPAFDVFPEDTVLCMRRVSTASVFTGVKKAGERYENHKEILKKLFAFTLPEDFVPRE